MYKPYSVGRWYRFFIESDGVTITLTNSDISGAVIENNAVVLPEGYRVMDVVTDINSIANSVGDTSQGNKIITSNGRQGYALPNASTFDYSFIYLFIRRNGSAPSVNVPSVPSEPSEPPVPSEPTGQTYNVWDPNTDIVSTLEVLPEGHIHDEEHDIWIPEGYAWNNKVGTWTQVSQGV